MIQKSGERSKNMITVEKCLVFLETYFSTNTYIVTDDETGDTAVVDPGLPENDLLEKLDGKNVKYILLTHGHFDHFGGAQVIKDNTDAKVVIHKNDVEMLHAPDKNVFNLYYAGEKCPAVDADIIAEDGTEIMLGNTKITVLHTPGHSSGSVCYLFKKDLVMFSGDTLFKLSAGRTDYYCGNPRTELMSLAKIADLEGNYKVYPGHDEETTLDYEREYNRYMKTRFRRK